MLKWYVMYKIDCIFGETIYNRNGGMSIWIIASLYTDTVCFTLLMIIMVDLLLYNVYISSFLCCKNLAQMGFCHEIFDIAFTTTNLI
jgi:hypothetical protein